MKIKSHERSPDKKGFSIALPIRLIEQLEAIAREEHRSRNGQIEFFLDRSVKEWKAKNASFAEETLSKQKKQRVG